MLHVCSIYAVVCQHTDQVSVLEVKPVKFIACHFSILDVLVYDEGGALGVVGDTLANLSNRVSARWRP